MGNVPQPANQEQDRTGLHAEEESQPIVTTAANLSTGQAPPAPLSPVEEETTAAADLPEAQRSALAVAAGFFLCAEHGRRYDLREIIPDAGYEGRDARRAFKKIPPEVLARHGIGTDGQGNFWRK
jgi:hypothetical protein